MIKISIIIALRNEAENVDKLFTSLRTINFSNSQYEIIFIDDSSSDDTYNKLKENINEGDNYFVFKAESKKYSGKKGALTLGVEKANFDYIMMTDADCIVSSEWLKKYSEKFDKGFDFIFAPSPFIAENNLVNKISCFENLRSSILTFSFFKMGFPYNAFGRNLGFSKKLFEKTKGYENTLETLSGDDDLLLREAVKRKLKIGIIEESDAFVYSYTKGKFKEYLKQKSRHLKTSHHYTVTIKNLLGIWHLINLIMLFSLFLVPIIPRIIVLPSMKILFDILIVKSFQKKYSYNFKIQQIFCLQIIYECFLILNFINSFIKKDRWN
ncbi:MAG TPA: glycosyltransferase [Ignavibacteriaceae bacterium]|nr:glycosyltransferase [Ignavibacteriaceae bacterium]